MTVASSWCDYFFFFAAAFFTGFFAAAFFVAMRTSPPFGAKMLVDVTGIAEIAWRVKYLSSSVVRLGWSRERVHSLERARWSWGRG